MQKTWKAGLATLAATALLAVPALAEDEARKTGWFDTAELSFVSTSGNSETQTLGFKNTLVRAWDAAKFTFAVGGVNGQSRPDSLTAEIDAGGNVTIVEPPKETTAEAYFARLRFDRNITDRFFWFTGAGWEQNRPAGIDQRLSGVAGVGNQWVARDDVQFRTDYGLTFTDEEDTLGMSDSYAGARFSWAYKNLLTESTTFLNDLILDFNLDESDDYRGDMVTALQVSISKRVALKTSLQLLYDNMPALDSVPVVLDASGSGLTEVIIERDDLDTIFSASLVVDF